MDFVSALSRIGIQLPSESAEDIDQQLLSALLSQSKINSAQAAMEFCLAQAMFMLDTDVDTRELDDSEQKEAVLNTLKRTKANSLESDHGLWGSHLSMSDLGLSPGSADIYNIVKLKSDEPCHLATICGLLFSSRRELFSKFLVVIDIRIHFRSSTGAAQFFADGVPYLSENHMMEEISMPVLSRVMPHIRVFRSSHDGETMMSHAVSVPARAFCFLWQESNCISKVWITCKDRFPQDIVIIKWVQTASRRFAGCHAEFDGNFSPSKLPVAMRSFYAKLVEATLSRSDFMVCDMLSTNIPLMKDTAAGRRLLGTLAEHVSASAERDQARVRQAADIQKATLIELGVDLERHGASSLPETHREGQNIGPAECGICFFEFDSGHVRVERPCCCQPLCDKCDRTCHGLGQPCAFCRQLVGQKVSSRRRRRR